MLEFTVKYLKSNLETELVDVALMEGYKDLDHLCSMIRGMGIDAIDVIDVWPQESIPVKIKKGGYKDVRQNNG